MRRKLLAGALSLCLALSLLPMSALAAGEDVTPAVASISVQKDGVTYVSTQGNDGSVQLALPGGQSLAGATLTITANTAVNFNLIAEPAVGALYASSVGEDTVGLNFNLAGLTGGDFRLNLTTEDHVTWTGTVGEAYAMTIADLAEQLAGASVQAGVMTARSGSATNPALPIGANSDLNQALLTICAPNQALASVNYVINGTVNTWQLPAGGPLYQPNFTSAQPAGWFYDTDYQQAVNFSQDTVSDGMTLYANTGSVSGAFMDAFTANESVLPIYNSTDWAAFVQKAASITSSQWVELLASIDCDNATYTPLTFAGDFNGNNFTISNATFSASSGYSGMFKSIGADQKICNLVLDGITAKYAGTYSGVLAGQISGTEGHNALIQNVQVKNSSASGRSAGGIAGFIFFADVTYCSSRNTTITGIANGGGIGGISYGQITNCYSTCGPTALQSTGGIAGKNLEGGLIQYCWCTESRVSERNTSATAANNAVSVNDSTDFNVCTGPTSKWNTGVGAAKGFKASVKYTFSS